MLSWVIGGLLLKVLHGKLATWMSFWLLGGMGVGVAAGCITGLRAKLREKAIPGETLYASSREGWPGLRRWGRQVLTLGVGVAIVSGMLVSVLAGVGQVRTIHALATFTYFFGLGLLCSLSLCLLWTLLGTAVGAFHGLVLGALFGALREGLTGPEIERRILPNQGIWQSMGNIRVFALGGGLTVGLLWGLLNLVPDVLMFWRAPQAEDWWYIVLNNVLFLGFLSGLVPGAACIQHFILRFVLWGNGVMPWRYVRFLDFATERMFLQRVGGHYRFFHDLLRDCFAAMEPKQGRVAAKTRKNLTQG